VFAGDNLQLANSREPVVEQPGQREARGEYTSQSGACPAGCRGEKSETGAGRAGSWGERRKEESETQPVKVTTEISAVGKSASGTAKTALTRAMIKQHGGHRPAPL